MVAESVTYTLRFAALHMLCPHCGNRFAGTAQFCVFCGRPLQEAARTLETDRGRDVPPHSDPTPVSVTTELAALPHQRGRTVIGLDRLKTLTTLDRKFIKEGFDETKDHPTSMSFWCWSIVIVVASMAIGLSTTVEPRLGSLLLGLVMGASWQFGLPRLGGSRAPRPVCSFASDSLPMTPGLPPEADIGRHVSKVP